MKTIWDKKWEKFNNSARSHSNLDMVTRAILKFIIRYIPDNAAKILETGCGTGRICFALAKRFPDSVLVGTDISQDSINLCNKSKEQKKINNTVFIKADIYALPFDQEEFDVSLSEGVLQHIPSDILGLKQMVRFTKKNGLVFAAVVNKNCLPHTIYKALKGKRYEHYPERSYTHKSLTKLFKEAGLDDIELCGVYPGYGMQRIEGYLPIIGPIITQIMYALAFITDRFTDNWFSNNFGIQIVAKGVKK